MSSFWSSEAESVTDTADHGPVIVACSLQVGQRYSVHSFRYLWVWPSGRMSPSLASHLRLTDWDWDKFIQHNMTFYRCMISDIHDSSYVLFSINLISNTSLHDGRPLLRPFLVAYAETKKMARQAKSVDIISEYLLRTNGQLFVVSGALCEDRQ